MRALSLLLGCVPVLGVVELGLHYYFAQRAPDFDDYARLGKQLAELKRPGEPLVVAPAWAEPLVRMAAPSSFPLTELARADDTSFAMLLEISALGAAAPELDGMPVEREASVGPFRLLWHKNPRFEPVRFDFVSAVEAGQVGVFAELSGELRECAPLLSTRASTGGLHGHVAYPRSRFDCGERRLVAATLIEDERYRPRRCVLAQLPDEAPVVLTFDAVPATSRLVGHVGFSYFLERDQETHQVELSVSEGGRALGAERASGSRGWARFQLPRSAAGAIQVKLRRLTPGGDVCFALEAR